MGVTQSQLFSEIWDERPHVSEISGCLLVGKNHQQWHWQMSHILGKGAFPKFKLKKENIAMITIKEHEYVTNHFDEARQDPAWEEYFKKYDKLREEYFADRRK